MLLAYSFNEVLTDAQEGVTPYFRDTKPVFIVEHICTSVEEMKATTRHPDYLSKVLPDEIHMTKTYMGGLPDAYCLVETVDFADPAPGEFRVFDFVRRRAELTPEDFAAGLKAEGQGLRSDPAICAVVRQRLHSGVQAHEPVIVPFRQDYDAVIEYWLDDPAQLASVAPRLRASQAHLVEAALSKSVLVRNRPQVSRDLSVQVA